MLLINMFQRKSKGKGDSIVTNVTISKTYSPAADKFNNTDPRVYLSETLGPMYPHTLGALPIISFGLLWG